MKICVYLLLVESIHLVVLDRNYKQHQTLGQRFYEDKNQHPCEVALTESDTPAGTPRIKEKECKCDQKTKQCAYKTTWSPAKGEGSPVTDFIISFYPYDIQEQAFCFKLPNTTNTFTFTKYLGLDVSRIEYYTFTVFALPIPYNLDQELETMRCPEPLKIINDLPFKSNIRQQDAVIFYCNFTGYPLPELEEIDWLFSSNQNLSKKIRLRNSSHVAIINNYSFSKLIISKVVVRNSGRYTCKIQNYFGSQDSKSGYLIVKEELSKKRLNIKLVILMISSALIVCIGIVVAAYRYFHRSTTNEYIYNSSILQKVIVYVSHCCKSKNEKEQLLGLLSHVQSSLPYLKIIVDLVEETAINNAGGLSQWIPEKISKAHFFLIILSNSYLNALSAANDSNDTESARKVFAEHTLITKMLYNRRINGNKIILILDGVVPHDMPLHFKDCGYHDIRCIYENNEFLNRFDTIDGIIYETVF